MGPREVRRTPCPAPMVAPGGMGLEVEDQAGRSGAASEHPLAPAPTALRRQGSDLEHPVFAAGGAGNPRDPTGRGKRPLAASPTSLQHLSQPAFGVCKQL